MNKIKDLKIGDKLQLIKEIAAGNVDRTNLTDETIVEAKEWFLAMMAMAGEDDESRNEIILIGEALSNCKKFFSDLENQEKLNEGIT